MMIAELIMSYFSWSDLWAPGVEDIVRYGPRGRYFHVGVWTGPDGDLLCVRRCETNEEADRCLAPPGWNVFDATLRSVAVRLALAVVDHFQDVEFRKWLERHPQEGPSAPIRFLEELCRGRDAFEKWLTKNHFDFRDFEDVNHQGVMFEDQGESWLAEFYDNGNFKQLVWA